jgi:hypothetical protein
MVLAVLVAAVAAAPQYLPYAGFTGLPYAAAPGVLVSHMLVIALPSATPLPLLPSAICCWRHLRTISALESWARGQVRARI